VGAIKKMPMCAQQSATKMAMMNQ